MFACEICVFTTSHKSNYTAHLKTKRHLTKLELSTVNPSITSQSEQIYTCNYCNNDYARLDSLQRHKKTCVNHIIECKDQQLKDNQKQIDDDKSENKELKNEIKELKNEIKELKQKNDELNNTIHEINSKQISVLQNNLKPANTNISQIIINNYPNAPNLGFPDNIPIDDSLKEYIQLGCVKGLGKLISDHWFKNLNPHDRSIWMVDPSRNKFLIRCKNAWVIDIDGIQFQELNLEKIQNIFDEYLLQNDFDTHDQIKTMEFINDIKTKPMIIKGLKDAGKYLVYDKEKYTDTERIENGVEPIPEIIPETITETTVD